MINIKIIKKIVFKVKLQLFIPSFLHKYDHSSVGLSGVYICM